MNSETQDFARFAQKISARSVKRCQNHPSLRNEVRRFEFAIHQNVLLQVQACTMSDTETESEAEDGVNDLLASYYGIKQEATIAAEV
jgi:hypothetical protein